jgi:hypothetical protein
LPVLAATWLISVSRASGTARRVLGSRRGLATLRAGLSASERWPSATACWYRAAQRRDQVFGGAAPAAGVAAGDHVGADVFGEPLHVGGGGFIESVVLE